MYQSLSCPCILTSQLIFNARLVVDVGTGIEVSRDENVRLDRENATRVIKEVVVEKEGEYVRKKAKELADNIKVKRMTRWMKRLTIVDETLS